MVFAAAGVCLVVAAAAGAAILLAIPDADAPATDGRLASAPVVPANAAGAAGSAEGGAVITPRVVEAPRTGGAPVEAAAPANADGAPTTPGEASEPGAAASTGGTAAEVAGAAATRTTGNAGIGTQPGSEPGGAQLQQALIAAAAARAGLPGAQDAAPSAPTPAASTPTAPAASVTTGFPPVPDDAFSSGSAVPRETVAGDAPTAGSPIDPGGFAVMPLPAPRQAGAAIATAPASAAPVETAAAATDAAPAAPAPEASVEVASTARSGRITSAVTLRAGPDNGAAALGVIPAGTNVAVVSCDYWCEVDFSGKRGWVYKSFVAAAP